MGLTYLSDAFHLLPHEGETLVSQLAGQTLGRGWLYLGVQASTMVILLLAANTCYAGFPMLSSLLAKDGYLPRQFASLGDRLVYSNGILILSGVSMVLLIAFQGTPTRCCRSTPSGCLFRSPSPSSAWSDDGPAFARATGFTTRPLISSAPWLRPLSWVSSGSRASSRAAGWSSS